jgi:predicted enzyme related to lactoylglutathione lyase
VAAFRFDCVFYYVSDLDRAIAFYTNVFGWQLSSRDVVARFHVDGVLVELVPAPGGVMPRGDGNARLTLAVDDLDDARLRLLAAGVRTSGIHVVSNGRLATLTDPDDNEIVVWQYTEPR